MFQFSKSQTIKSRVESVLNSHLEVKSSAWLLSMGYQTCNDYAEQVRQIVSSSSGFEHVRFETVARCIRAFKVKLVRREEALKSHNGTVQV